MPRKGCYPVGKESGKLICVNLFGGAGIGKSTLAAEIFSELKKRGYNTELVGEYAKDVVYQESTHLLDNQLWIFANQAFRLRNLAEYGVQIAVCDSPLLLSIAYQRVRNETKSFSSLVREEFEKYQNFNYLLIRDDNYWEKDGRVGNLTRAKIMDSVIESVLSGYDYKIVLPEMVLKDVMRSI